MMMSSLACFYCFHTFICCCDPSPWGVAMVTGVSWSFCVKSSLEAQTNESLLICRAEIYWNATFGCIDLWGTFFWASFSFCSQWSESVLTENFSLWSKLLQVFQQPHMESCQMHGVDSLTLLKSFLCYCRMYCCNPKPDVCTFSDHHNHFLRFRLLRTFPHFSLSGISCSIRLLCPPNNRPRAFQPSHYKEKHACNQCCFSWPPGTFQSWVVAREWVTSEVLLTIRALQWSFNRWRFEWCEVYFRRPLFYSHFLSWLIIECAWGLGSIF